MDAADEAILRELGTDARLPFRELGKRVGLSANAAAARVRRMVDDGTIVGFTLRRGPRTERGTGRPGLEVFIDVRLRDGIDATAATRMFARFAEILDAVHVTGPYDYLVHAVVPEAAALDQLLRTLKESGAIQTSTRLALREPPS